MRQDSAALGSCKPVRTRDPARGRGWLPHRVLPGWPPSRGLLQGRQCAPLERHTHQELHVLPHGNRVYGLAFSPDGTRLATGCSENTIRMWDIASGQDVCELRGHQAYVHAVAFSHDGTRLASASGDLTVRIWGTVPASARRDRQTPMSCGESSPREWCSSPSISPL